MRNLIKLGILLNIIGLSGLFYWETELKKEAVKIEKARRELPSEEKVLEYFLQKYERKWSYKNKQVFLNAIRVTSKHYNIDKFDLMTFVALESNYKITARGKKNSNGTYDAGLTQQNSNYYKGRYKIVSSVAKRYGLEHDINNKFDITLNVLSCGYFVNSLRSEIYQKYGDGSEFRLIASYNTGIAGFKRFPSKAREYYTVFKKLKSAGYNA
jgi:soluble lytic murein transglycosylase-like protein